MRTDLHLEQRRLHKLRRQTECADRFDAERRKQHRKALEKMKVRHQAERKFLTLQRRFEECRILKKRERQKPIGFLAWFCKATGIKGLIERKRITQDEEREHIKREALRGLEKSQRQEKETLKRQYEIMTQRSIASKRLEESLTADLGIRERSRANPLSRAERVSVHSGNDR